MSYIILFPGSFNPITTAHIMTADSVRISLMREVTDCKECRIIFSPVGDGYSSVKSELLPAKERVLMAELMTADIPYMEVSSWEAEQKVYTRTLMLLEHAQEEYPTYNIVLACGGDMALTMVTDAWNCNDVTEIMKKFKIMVVPRPYSGNIDDEANITEEFKKYEFTKHYLHNVMFAKDVPISSVSSTIVRERISRGLSTLGLIPQYVRNYIDKKKYYIKK